MSRAVLQNAMSLPLADVPLLSADKLAKTLSDRLAEGGRLCVYFGWPLENGAIRLCAVVARDSLAELELLGAEAREAFPSLAADHPQAQLFEREIAEQCGLRPEGHPWQKPVRYTRSYSVARDASGQGGEDHFLPGAGEFYRVKGDEVHEVAVGPVHAGIIEPGHFRFQCHGEEVHHLEIALGYQHRGVERALVGGVHPLTIHHVETLAGDTTIGHATAYAQALEALSCSRPPFRALALRAMALELERLANHTGDLGALANDVGFLPTASYCGRLRGDFLNLTALFCGNRFGRGWVRPGGVAWDAEDERLHEFRDRLAAVMADVENAVNLLWDSTTVMARFEDTGTVSQEAAIALGLVGPAARASGVARDVRRDHPSGWWRLAQVPVLTCESGDVFGRAFVRWIEIQHSAEFLQEQARNLPGGAMRAEIGLLAPERIAVSLVEGWRGEICHVAVTDRHGRFARYKVVDPSFHNWMGLALALRGQQISDFPLCNKSFNLSYCGHDL